MPCFDRAKVWLTRSSVVPVDRVISVDPPARGHALATRVGAVDLSYRFHTRHRDQDYRAQGNSYAVAHQL